MNEIKKINLKKKTQKPHESTNQTRNSSHEIKITS